MFEIDYEPTTACLRVVSRGFWDVPTARAFHRELSVTFAEIAAVGRTIKLLSDARTFAIQAPEVAAVFSDAAFMMSRVPIEKWAIVQPKALQRLQFRRTSPGYASRAFDTIEDALRWLDWPAMNAAGTPRYSLC